MPRFRVTDCKHAAPGPCSHVRCRYHEQAAIDSCVLTEIARARGALSLRKVGTLLGVSAERARQIETRAMDRFAHGLEPVKHELVEALRGLEGDRRVEPEVIREGDLPDLSDRDARKPWIRRGT